jgi:hypothetical protein
MMCIGVQQKWSYYVKKDVVDNTEFLLRSIGENYRDTRVGSEWWVRMDYYNIIKEVTTKSSFVHRFCS